MTEEKRWKRKKKERKRDMQTERKRKKETEKERVHEKEKIGHQREIYVNEIGMKGHRQIISKNCPLGNTVQKVSERPNQIRLTILKLKELKFHLGKA